MYFGCNIIRNSTLALEKSSLNFAKELALMCVRLQLKRFVPADTSKLSKKTVNPYDRRPQMGAVKFRKNINCERWKGEKKSEF